MQEEKEMKVCLTCGKESTKRCSRCISAHYCSIGCQKEDWPLHKTRCRADPHCVLGDQLLFSLIFEPWIELDCYGWLLSEVSKGWKYAFLSYTHERWRAPDKYEPFIWTIPDMDKGSKEEDIPRLAPPASIGLTRWFRNKHDGLVDWAFDRSGKNLRFLKLLLQPYNRQVVGKLGAGAPKRVIEAAACEHGRLDIIERYYTEAPIYWNTVSFHGCPGVLRWFAEKYPEAMPEGDWSSFMCQLIAEEDLEDIKWFDRNPRTTYIDRVCLPCKRRVEPSVEKMDWIAGHYVLGKDISVLSEMVAGSGSIDLLDWFIQRYGTTHVGTAHVSLHAATYGHFKFIKEMDRRGLFFTCAGFGVHAVAGGCIELVEWARARGIHCSRSVITEKPRPGMIKWIRDNPGLFPPEPIMWRGVSDLMQGLDVSLFPILEEALLGGSSQPSIDDVD